MWDKYNDLTPVPMRSLSCKSAGVQFLPSPADLLMPWWASLGRTHIHKLAQGERVPIPHIYIARAQLISDSGQLRQSNWYKPEHILNSNLHHYFDLYIPFSVWKRNNNLLKMLMDWFSNWNLLKVRYVISLIFPQVFILIFASSKFSFR